MTFFGFMLLRPAFQLADQYVGGATMVFSAVFFCWFVYLSVKGAVRFTRFELVFFLYFGASTVVSALYGASPLLIISNFNKLFLCFFCLKALSFDSFGFTSRGWYRAFQAATYTCAAYVVVSLAIPSSYVVEWGARTFEMAFSHQHLAATFIISLIANVYFDMGLTPRSSWTLKFLLVSVLMYALLMTGARTFTLCGAVLYGFLVVRYLDAVDRRIRPVVGLVVLSVIVAYIYWNAGDFTFFQKNNNLSDRSFSNGREDIWGYYGGMFAESSVIEKVFGQGVGFIDSSALSIGTHNDVLYFALSFGVVGLALFLVFVLRSIWSVGRVVPSIAAITLFVFCAVSNGFSEYTDFIVALAAFLASSRFSQAVRLSSPDVASREGLVRGPYREFPLQCRFLYDRARQHLRISGSHDGGQG